MKPFPPAFYRVAAVASCATAITTLMLIFLPFLLAAADDFAGRMQRVLDPVYVLRSWAAWIHPFLAFAAALAVAVRLRSRPHLVLPGVLGFGFWAGIEGVQQAMTLFMFNPWRRAWLAGDPAIRATMELRTAVYDGLYDASYMALLVGILIGCGFYAAALLRLDRLSRLVGAFYAAAALLTLSYFIGELGQPVLPASWEPWVYAATQPLGRTLIGVWLWKYADEAAPIDRQPTFRREADG
jgi:hypothetical protein